MNINTSNKQAKTGSPPSWDIFSDYVILTFPLLTSSDEPGQALAAAPDGHEKSLT